MTRLEHQLLQHTDKINNLLARYGVKFGIYKNNVFREQLFPFDSIPRIIEHDEFEMLERGLKQRVLALNLFLKDIYSDKSIVRSGVVPEDFIFASSGYMAECEGVLPIKGIYSHISGIDLVKGKDNEWYILEDNLRVPSGASYPMIARDLCRMSSPETFQNIKLLDNRNYADLLRKAAEGEAGGDMVKAAVSKDVNTNLDCIYNTNNAAYEVMALGAEGVRNLIKAIGETAEYDCVVFNLECDYTIANFTVMELSTKTYLLGTGQKESNAAMTRLTEVISKYDDATKLAVAKARTAALNTEEGEKVEIPNRASIVGKAEVFYNKFVNRTSVTEKLMGYDIYGVLNLVKERTDQKFIASMSKQELIANCIVKNV